MPKTLLAITIVLLVGAAGLGAAEPAKRGESEDGPLNIATPTLGGKQFWTDLVHFHDWRIQQNTYTSHCRLLDGNNYRRAWGSREHCQQKLDYHRRRLGLPPMEGKAVVLLHGLARSRTSMQGLADYLEREGSFKTFNITYASTRRSLDDHAKALASVIEQLEGIDEINFVAHSLGNLVIRRYLAMQSADQSRQLPDQRIKRIVMLGPPNNGSELATTFRGNGLMHLIAGDPAVEIAENWDTLETRLAIPVCQFGIIAGDLAKKQGFSNPLILGKDDFVISIKETRLPGANDFLVAPVYHGSMMDDEEAQQAVLRFFQHGYFVSAAKRMPIPPLQPAE